MIKQIIFPTDIWLTVSDLSSVQFPSFSFFTKNMKNSEVFQFLFFILKFQIKNYSISVCFSDIAW